MRTAAFPDSVTAGLRRRARTIRRRPARLERQAVDDFEHEARELVVVAREPAGDELHGSRVVALEAAAERVGQQLRRDGPREGVAVGRQDVAQLIRARELASVRQLPRRVDRELAFRLAPRANGVEVLEAEAERIHAAMARRADGVLAVFLELLAHRRRRSDLRFVEIRHIGRRLRRRGIQEIVEDPLAAQHRRRARRVRGDREDAALRQHAAARRGGQVDLPELRSRDVRHAIVARETLVQERVAAVDEIEDAAILPDDRLEEELRLAAHRQPQVVFELRELVAIPRQRFERAELQPLAAEVLGECLRLRIPQHPPHLEGEDLRIAQRARIGRPPKFGVGHARPQEVRQPRRQLVRRNLVEARRSGSGSRDRPLALDAEQEVGRHEERLDPDREALVERVLLFLRRLRQLDILLDFARRDRTPERAPRQGGHDARGARRQMLAVAMAADVDLLDARPRRPLSYEYGPPTSTALTRTPFSGIFASSAVASSKRLRNCSRRSGVRLAGGLNSRGGSGRVDGLGPAKRTGRPS